MMNLFSSFDPFCLILTFKMSLNWISSLIGLFFMPLIFHLKKNRLSILFTEMIEFLKKEMSIIISSEKIGSYLIFITLFMFIMFNNVMGLFPYIFTSSSHLTFTLTFSITFWISFMVFGWMNNTNKMFSHLVPVGTPSILMPLLVCIESISNFIRLGTLAIRLTANMISGHLLLTLMGSSMQSTEISLKMVSIFILFQCLLMILEISVSFIQTYVFSILTCIYSTDSN